MKARIPRFWIDTNILLRLATRQPPEMFERAGRLVERAEAGEFSLRVHPMQVAEACFVLAGHYRCSRPEIRERLRTVLSLRALEVWDETNVLAALDLMADRGVDFDDAYLALWAAGGGDGVASFDRDFRKLPARHLEP